MKRPKRPVELRAALDNEILSWVGGNMMLPAMVTVASSLYDAAEKFRLSRGRTERLQIWKALYPGWQHPELVYRGVVIRRGLCDAALAESADVDGVLDFVTRELGKIARQA